MGNHSGRIQRQFAPRGLCREEEHLVQLLRRQGLEHRKQGANGLADPGRCLGHQAPASTDSLEHRFGQMTLPWPKAGVGKRQLLRRPVAPFAMSHFLLGPAQEPCAMLLEEQLQLRGTERLDQTGFLFADDVEIHQRQIDLLKIQFAAHQPAVDFRLGPVQLSVVGRLLAQVAPVGLDLFQAVLRGIVAVRPALDGQALVMAFEGHFTLVAFAAPRGDRTMADNAFQGSR
ncbi:hypothetical protein D3C87_1168920 [compost metagenome]